MSDPWNQVELLVTVKAYPAISRKYGEAVCVAGIRTDTPSPEWVRLFPVDWRDRQRVEQFKKYDIIKLQGKAHGTDQRPETLRPNLSHGFEVVGHLPTGDGWARRRRHVEPLMIGSMCELVRRQKETGMSLGVFRPREIHDFTIEQNPSAGRTAGQDASLSQMPLFTPSGDGPTGDLEEVPFVFRYRFRCDEAGCRGHHQSLIDWEVGESWRRWRHSYPEDELKKRLREKWLDEVCGSDRDTAFFAGNIHRYPASFVIIGVFWPPKTTAALRDQLTLS